MKKILVLMSSYNGHQYIEQQIRSIMEQECRYEIYLRIRDDGSKDNTCEIIEKLCEEYTDRIELIKGENIGCNKSFFWLINNADGYDYYSISDQDDVWLPDKLEVACDYLEKEDPDIPLLYASTSYLTKNDLIPYGQTRKQQREFTIYNTLIQTICPGHTQVFNDKLLQLIKGDIDFDRLYMYDLWTTNVASLYGKIVFNNESFTYYRQHENNQLGSGKSFFGKLMMSFKRTMSDDGLKIRKQVEYFTEKNKDKLVSDGYIREINRYIDASCFTKRVKYIFSKDKMYRQSRFETVAFCAAVIIGKF